MDIIHCYLNCLISNYFQRNGSEIPLKNLSVTVFSRLYVHIICVTKPAHQSIKDDRDSR